MFLNASILFITMDKKNKIIVFLYLIWAVVTFVIVLPNKDLYLENITHVLILIFFVLQIVFYKIISKLPILDAKKRFILLGVIFASIVEGFYMISDPVFESLKVTSGLSLFQILSNYAIDLLFTVPVYIAIFYAIWFFINKYDYNFWEYLIFISLGQSLGDGGFFFLANPLALVFLPYVMLNYHSMNLIPYMLVKSDLKKGKKSIMRFVIPPIALIAIYFVLGFIIQIIGAIVGLV